MSYGNPFFTYVQLPNGRVVSEVNYKAAANPYRIKRRGEAVLYKGNTTPSFGNAEPCFYIYLWHLDK